ncbi:unnamed protein product [Prunus armeniaca]
MKLSGIIVNILKWDFWLKDRIAPVSLTLSLSRASLPLSSGFRDSHRGRPRFGRPFAHPATKVDGAGTEMTGPPSSSYPGQVPPPAAVISPENEEKSSGFDRKFAGFVLRRPAAIFGDQGETLPKFWQKVSCPKSSLVKEDIVLRSEPGVGVMPGSPQGSSRVSGNSGRVLSAWYQSLGSISCGLCTLCASLSCGSMMGSVTRRPHFDAEDSLTWMDVGYG